MKETILSTPAIIYDEAILARNLSIIKQIETETGCSILYALKASYAALPFLQGKNVVGEVSSLYEARYATEMLKEKCHAFLVALTAEDWNELRKLVSHVSFNSISQGAQFASSAREEGISCGIRINPRVQLSSHLDYDPCESGGRFGISISELPNELPQWIKGLHFHALCENGAEQFAALVDTVEKKAKQYLQQVEWINFGGGHLLTKDEYRRDILIQRLKEFRRSYPHLKVFLEPGAAWVWDAAVLKTEVVDIIEREGIRTALLDVSFRAHLSDFLVGSAPESLPLSSPDLCYIDPLAYNTLSQELKNRSYRLGGSSCAACDFKQFYQAQNELHIGQIISFLNMGHYCDVTFSLFNGVRPPSIYYRSADCKYRLMKYHDYRSFEALYSMNGAL